LRERSSLEERASPLWRTFIDASLLSSSIMDKAYSFTKIALLPWLRYPDSIGFGRYDAYDDQIFKSKNHRIGSENNTNISKSPSSSYIMAINVLKEFICRTCRTPTDTRPPRKVPTKKKSRNKGFHRIHTSTCHCIDTIPLQMKQ